LSGFESSFHSDQTFMLKKESGFRLRALRFITEVLLVNKNNPASIHFSNYSSIEKTTSHPVSTKLVRRSYKGRQLSTRLTVM